ncbi:MAG: DUF58 domain-containing protein [Phycisphaerales bacterium]|nr:DUF58 domain-containing protein [Phycisphaerales bacterium]
MARSHDRDEGVSPRSGHPGERAVRRESRLTFGGLIYIGVTVFVAIGAVNSQNNLLFWLFGVAIATIIVSGLFSGNALMKTRLRARVLHEVRAGQAQRLHYSVSNRSSVFPLFACLISEESERVVQNGKLVPASVVHVAPNGSLNASGSFTPHARGRYVLRDIRLSTRFPFGLMQKSLVFEQARPLLVLPHTLHLRKELISATASHGEQVLRRSDRGGTSNEFWGLREYRPGDPRRRISWKHSARRHDLVVIEHAESFALRIWFVIAEPNRIESDEDRLHAERAIAIAAGLLDQAGRKSTPVGLWYPQRSIRFDPSSGRAQAGRAARSLALIQLDEPSEQLTSVPVRTRDRVVLIQRGSRVPQPIQASRIIDTERPKDWLVNPDTLPQSLRGQA